MASILDLRIRDLATMPVMHPISGEPLMMPDGRPQTITLYGLDSAPYRRTLAQVLATRQGGAPVADEEVPELTRTLVAACIQDWTLEAADGSEMPAPTPETAGQLLAEPGLGWLVRQCDVYIATRAHYLGEDWPG